MPRVSIVIPAYNAAPHLAETLSSVVNSTYDDFDVIVVNDGSNDETSSVAAKFGARVRVLEQENLGMSASRNRGIGASDSELIALLDSDDVWHPEKLKHQVTALDVLKDHAFCFTDFTVWTGEPPSAYLCEPREGSIDTTKTGWIYHELILTNLALPSSVVFRREAWQASGPFRCDDQQTDDWEYLVRASQSFRFIRLAESMVLYRQHPASLSQKLPSRNNGELMRESLIGRFGLRSTDGAEVDAQQLDRWRYLGWSNFADAHCARGQLALGLHTFGQLLFHGPHRANSLLRLLKALSHRALRRR